uniref:Ubiquitin-like protease family profile domain-containing protein n=1 Tax=Ditylenchus dipsaci TaxID=166011 RepID=A0A915DZS0_9BILA
MFDKESNKPRGVSSFMEGIFAPLQSKKKNLGNENSAYGGLTPAFAYNNRFDSSLHFDSNYRNTMDGYRDQETPTFRGHQSDGMHGFDFPLFHSHQPSFLHPASSETFSPRRNPVVATPIFDAYVPRHKPMINCAGFRQTHTGKQINQLESVDIDALDEYKNFLKDLNAGKSASPFDRFSTPLLPQRTMRSSAAAIQAGAEAVHACSPNTMMNKIASTLEMLRSLPKLVDGGSKMVRSGSAADGYRYLDSAPSPRNALVDNQKEVKSQPTVIDLTKETDQSKNASELLGESAAYSAQESQAFAACTSSASPATAKLPMYHPQNRRSMDSTARTWREKKYMDEEEQRMASIRDLQQEIDLRSMARNNRQIVNEEHRRLKLSMEGLILERRAPEKEEFPELPEDALELLQKAWNRSGPQDEVFTKGFGVDIMRKDLLSLRGLEWLNDEVINFYMNLICERSKQEPALPKTYAFSTFFYASLCGKGYAAVKRWTRKVDIFSYDLLIVPIHLTAHWCLATVDFKQETICYFDSLLGENNRCLNALEEYLQSEHIDKKKKNFDMSNWSLICRKDIPQQLNGSDCGMFSCKFAEYVSRRAAITFDQSNMPYFRQRMVYEVVSQKLL